MTLQRILIVTKTYPSISQKYRETVCTAGVLLDDLDRPLGWVRLYPIPYRLLENDQKFKRWSIIQASIERNTKDSRLESYRIDIDSIVVEREVDTSDSWRYRKELVLHPSLQFPSTEVIKSQGRSLGLIKPLEITKCYYESDAEDWTPAQKRVLNQESLFEKPLDLEKIPYRFGYEFIDADHKKHRYSIIDWEIKQLYRNSRDKKLESNHELWKKSGCDGVQLKLSRFIEEKDLYFLLGNLKNRPQTFTIIGLIYPPKVKGDQLSLCLY